MATNRIDILDPALLRPGRIDRKIEFPPPNEEARLDILKIHSRKMNLTRGINLRKIAELMPGASGAEVKVCFSSSPVLSWLLRRTSHKTGPNPFTVSGGTCPVSLVGLWNETISIL